MDFPRILRIAIQVIALLLFLLSRGLATAQDRYGTRALGTSVPGGDFTSRITRYDLTIRDTIVNYTGKARKAFTEIGRAHV